FTVYEGRPYVIHTDKEYRKFILKKFNGSNIKYDGNGAAFGSVPVDLNAYRDGESVTVQGNTGGLGKTGYTFAGWNTAADGSGIDYAENEMFMADIHDVTLYAQWEANAYLVTFDAGDGTVDPATQTKRYDAAYG